MLSKPIGQLSWEIWYQVNQDYVAEELCENTDKPELECNGKCYLMKQLAKAESQTPEPEEDSALNPFSLRVEIWTNPNSIEFIQNSDSELITQHYWLYRFAEKSVGIEPLEHPPTFS